MMILFNEHVVDSRGFDGQQLDITEVFLYPNPVVETLYLSGVPNGTEVYLYASNGAVVGSMLCTGSTLSANVSHLKSGIYFLKIADKAVKFIKK